MFRRSGSGGLRRQRSEQGQYIRPLLISPGGEDVEVLESPLGSLVLKVA